MTTISTPKKQEPDSESAVEFLQYVRPDGPWTVAAIDPNVTGAIPVVATFKGAAEVGAMLEWIEKRNGKVNLYFMPNPTKRRMRKKPFETDIARFDFAHVECDPLDGESAADARERHRAKLKSGVVPRPTLLWSTGNGIAALWCIERPVKLTDEASIAACKATNKGLAEALGGKVEGVDNVQNLDRLLRLPYTSNIPVARKLDKGRKIELAGDVEHDPARVYSEFDLPAADLPSIVPGEVRAIGEAVSTEDLSELATSDRVREIIEYGRVRDETKPKDDSRSAWRFEAICCMIRDGIADEVILGILTDPCWQISERVLDHPRPEEYAAKEIARARRRIAGAITAEFDCESVDVLDEDVTLEGLKPAAKDRFKALTFAELRNCPPLEYLVEGIIPANSLFEIYGKEKSGKTFFAIDAGLCIATGTEFHDLKVKQGRVLHIIGEGNRKSFSYRLEAWIKSKPKADRERLAALIEKNFHTLPMPMHVDVPAEVNAFIKANPGEWTLVTVDTLMRNMVGHISDPKDMGAFVTGCDLIREKTSAAVLVLHHEGKDASRGGMGSITMNAAVDGIGRFERTAGGERVFHVVTLRDADDRVPPMVFSLEDVTLEVDMDEGPEDKTRRSAILRFVRYGKRKEVRTESAEDRVLRAIHSGTPQSQSEIAAALGVTRQAIGKVIASLRGKGYLAKEGLILTAEGVEWAQTLAAAEDMSEV